MNLLEQEIVEMLSSTEEMETSEDLGQPARTENPSEEQRNDILETVYSCYYNEVMK